MLANNVLLRIWSDRLMRTIDADALIEKIKFREGGFVGYREIFNIEEMPTIDAVPVVRCVDCKHRYTFVCPMYHTETYIGDLDGFDDDYEVDRTDDDGFCHLGERWECEEDD